MKANCHFHMIRWLVQSVVAHPDLLAGRPPVGLLTPLELGQYQDFLSPNRRRDWLLGRWTAKRLVQTHFAAEHGFHPTLDSFTIEQEPSGAPYVSSRHSALRGTSDDGRMPLSLSISHSHGYAFCVVCTNDTGRMYLGADLERVEPRADEFTQEFFTAEEQANISAASPALTDLLVTATWSVKEAVLKATHLGLRIDPRSIRCHLRPARPRHWTPLQVEMQPSNPAQWGELGPLRLWWRVLDNRLLPDSSFVLTLAAYGVSLS
jgi:4'-phosphopantetheinyl transferase